MLKIIAKLLLCVRVAYWYEYCDDIKESVGSHWVGFSVITIYTTVFFVGVLMIVLLLFFFGYQYNSPDLFDNKAVDILLCMPFGIYATYLLCYKNNRYLAGKDYLSQFPIEQQKKIGKKCVIKCWTLACSPGLILLLIMASKMQ